MFDNLLADVETQDGIASEGSVVGIDLGTTNSVIATVIDGVPNALADSDGTVIQPSVVAWLPDGSRLAGTRAAHRRLVDPENTAHSIKRIIGQPFDLETTKSLLSQMPYAVTEGENHECLIGTRAGTMPVPQVSSYVLQHLSECAATALGTPVSECVITVPAHFSDTQRAATRRAAELAGLQVLRLINEPTAAALAYGQNRQLNERIAIFDFGGGTFDVTLLAVRSRLYEVIATGGDPFLGGDDIDQLLLARLAKQFLKEHRIDPMADPVARSRLHLAAEQIKKQLSTDEAIEAGLTGVAQGKGGKALGLNISMKRKQLEDLMEPLVNRALSVTERVLADSGIAPGAIDDVILVGGSTRIPRVQQLVAEFFDKQPLIDLDPMQVVALGAALQGQRLKDPSSDQRVLLDVTSHSLRVATAGGYSRVLVEKSKTIPAEGTASFNVAQDGQKTVEVKLAQGESERFADNTHLGTLVLDDLPEGRRGDLTVKIVFTIDADGMMQISARELSTGRATRTTLSVVGLGAAP